MSALRQAAEQALEALKFGLHVGFDESSESQIKKGGKAFDQHSKAFTALRAALAEPVQEPVAWQERQARRMRDRVVTEWTDWYPCRYRTLDEARSEASDHIPYEWRPLYTAPPQRKPLTEEEIIDAVRDADLDWARGWTLDKTQGNRFATLARAIERAHGITP